MLANASTYCVYDGGNVLAEYDDDGVLKRRYFNGPAVDQGELKTPVPVSDSRPRF